jgi:hypothetical protein
MPTSSVRYVLSREDDRQSVRFHGPSQRPGCSRASAPASRSRPPTTAERLEARAAELQRDGARVFKQVADLTDRGQAGRRGRHSRSSRAAVRSRAKRDCERRTRELQTALDTTRTQAREEAYRTQHFYAAALSDLLNDLRGDLERIPPDVEAALIRVRKLLAGERPAA